MQMTERDIAREVYSMNTDMEGVCVVKDTCSVYVLNPSNTSSSSLNS